MTERTRKAYDRLTEYYDADDNPLITLEYQPVVSAVDPRPGDHLLEAACGTGRYIRDWLRLGANISGFDVSERMLAIAQEKFPELDLVRADLEERLSYKGESFDAVNCSQALKHIANLVPTLHEFQRVLKPGGKAVFSVTHPNMKWDGFEMSRKPKFAIGQETDIFHHSFDSYTLAAERAGFELAKVQTVRISSVVMPLLTASSFRQVRGRPMVAIFILRKR